MLKPLMRGEMEGMLKPLMRREKERRTVRTVSGRNLCWQGKKKKDSRLVSYQLELAEGEQ